MKITRQSLHTSPPGRALSSAFRGMLGAFALGAMLLPGLNTSAQVISVDFVGGYSGNQPQNMGPTEVAGVVPVANWNNAATNLTATGTLTNAVDSTGAATTVSIDYAAPNTWGGYFNETPGNRRMMKGFLDTSNTTGPTITVTGLDAAKTYAIYVYSNDGNANRVGGYTIGSTTYYLKSTGGTGDSFTPSSSTDPNNATVANYVVFGVTGQTSFVLNATPVNPPPAGADNTPRAPINGLQIQVITLPTTPTGLAALAGDRRVLVSANAVNGAAGYIITRTGGTGGPVTFNSAASTYNDTAVINGTAYSYTIKATNTLGTSAASAPVSATPQAGIDGNGITGQYYDDGQANAGYGPNFNYAANPTPTVTQIDPIINLDVNGNNGYFQPAGIGHDNFNVQWLGAVKAQVTGQYIFTTASDDGSRLYLDGQLIVDNYLYQGVVTISSAPVTLVAGTKHIIRYQYFQGGGGGEAHFYWSYPGQGQQTVPQYALYTDITTFAPYAPTLAGAPGANSAVLSFNAPENATSYNILRSTTNGSGYTIVPGGSGVTGNVFTDSGLTNGTTYYYIVRAVNGAGTSPNSNQIAISPIAPVVGTGDGLTGTYYTGGALNFSAETGMPFFLTIDPTINFSQDNPNVNYNPGPWDAPVPHDQFTAVWTGQVQAQFTGNYIFQTVTDDGARLTIDSDAASNIVLFDDENGHGPLANTGAAVPMTAGKKYNVKFEYTQGGGGRTAQLLFGLTGAPLQIIPQTQLYSYPANTKPAQVVGLTGSNYSTTNYLSFTGAAGAQSYTIRRGTAPGVYNTTIPVTGTSYQDTGLTLGTTYYYAVFATNAAGNGPNSAEIALTPTAPAPFIASDEIEYTAGADLNTQNGGLGWADAWATLVGTSAVISTPGLTPPSGSAFANLKIAGNAVSTLANEPGGSQTFRHVSSREGSFHGTNTVFMSYLARVNPANTANLGSDGFAGVSLWDEGAEQYFTGIRYNNTAYGIESEQGQGGSNTGITPDSTIHFFVFQMDFTDTNVTISEFVDPTPGAALPATPDATQTVTAFSFNRIRIANGNSGNAIQEDFDEVRLGRTFAAVSPINGATVNGQIQLESVPDLTTTSSAAPLGTFTVEFRTPGTQTVILTSTVTLTPVGAGSPFGKFSISSVPTGTYDVRIKGGKNLAVLLPSQNITGTVTLANVKLPAGDGAPNNAVDLNDFGLLVNAFGSDASISGSGYDPRSDFTFDGRVDLSDFGALVNNFGGFGAP